MFKHFKTERSNCKVAQHSTRHEPNLKKVVKQDVFHFEPPAVVASSLGHQKMMDYPVKNGSKDCQKDSLQGNANLQQNPEEIEVPWPNYGSSIQQPVKQVKTS
jgi:hypothetical protein